MPHHQLDTSDYLPLSGPEIAPKSGKAPKQLLILLHGLGADGNDLIGLSQDIAPVFPEMQFFSPHAPFPCDFSPFGYQWFSLQDFSMQAIEQGVAHAAPLLKQSILAKSKALGVPSHQVFLLGFSQGTMLACDVALYSELTLGGVVGFSGLLAPHHPTPMVARTPICLIHGTDDQVVPHHALADAEAALNRLNVPHETHSIAKLGHGINQQGLTFALEFLKKQVVAA